MDPLWITFLGITAGIGGYGGYWILEYYQLKRITKRWKKKERARKEDDES